MKTKKAMGFELEPQKGRKPRAPKPGSFEIFTVDMSGEDYLSSQVESVTEADRLAVADILMIHTGVKPKRGQAPLTYIGMLLVQRELSFFDAADLGAYVLNVLGGAIKL